MVYPRETAPLERVLEWILIQQFAAAPHRARARGAAARFTRGNTSIMAKTTRKTETTGTAPKARPVRRKPVTAKASVEAPAAHAAPQAPAEVPAAKALKAPRNRPATATRTTTRKASTVAAEPAVAADRAAVIPAAITPLAISEPTHGEIAERAYHIYLRRNGWPGNPDHDWLQALEELRAERRSR